MKTSDIFKTRASKLNESMEKVFGKKLNLESFGLEQLQDARNKLRTQVSQVRTESGFNENLENEAFHHAQWMLDAINAEISEREEFIADPHVAEVSTEEGYSSEVEEFFHTVANSDDGFDMLYAAHTGKYGKDVEKAVTDMYDNVSVDNGYHGDDDFEEIYGRMLDNIEADYGNGDSDHEGGETDDAYALASAGHGSDEDYGSFDYDETVDFDKIRSDAADSLKKNIDKQSDDRISSKRNPPEDKKQKGFWQSVGDKQIGMVKGAVKGAIKGFSGKEDIAMEKAPPTAKGERMVKHIKAGYAKDGKLTDKEKSIAYATAWKAHNKKTESVNTGDNMTRLTEGEIQQASAIVNAKTMVDRVGRWIEELSGMENDTLLQLGDSIRDEMSQELAKTFISAVAPAIQQALENLKQTRETLASGVRMLTGEEQGAEMIGSEPTAPEAGEEMGTAEPDSMNAGDELDSLTGGEDEFGAADAAVGGLETAGREKRESVDFSNKLLKVLAG